MQEDKRTCPLGHECDKCKWYQNIKGVHPQTGEQIDSWDCAILWHNVLTIENTSRVVGVSAAVESFRNETVKAIQKAAAKAAIEAHNTKRSISDQGHKQPS